MDFLEEEAEIGQKTSWRTRIGFLRQLLVGRERDLALVGLLMAVSVAAEVAGPLVLRHLIDVRVPAGRLGGMVEDAGLYLLLGIILSGAFYGQVCLGSKVGLGAVADLKLRLFRKVLQKDLAFFNATTPGALMARVESDAERVQTLCSQAAGELVRNVLLVGGTLAVMANANWRMTLLVVVLLSPALAAMPFFFPLAYRLYRKARAAYTDLSSTLTEVVGAALVIQAYGAAAWALEKVGEANRRLFKTERKAALVDYSFWSVVYSLEIVLVGAVVWLSSSRVRHHMSLGTLVLFMEYARQMFYPLVMLGEQVGFVNRAFASVDRVFQLLASTDHDEPANSQGAVPPPWEELRCEGVSFSYDGSTKVLEDVTFSVRRGERVALVGLSGAGKTTIVNLLLRFCEPQSGRITVDGVDIRSFSLRAWRAQVGLVLQDMVLFPGTVEENVRALAEDITREQVVEALEVVRAGTLAKALPQGLDTHLAEGGANLSVGERQLLSIARAVVRNPRLLILDEATSSVDAATELALQESMERAAKNRTVLIVAHRLSTLRRVDRILVVHQGRVVEQGSHAELYGRNGLYRMLHDLQAVGIGGMAG